MPTRLVSGDGVEIGGAVVPVADIGMVAFGEMTTGLQALVNITNDMTQIIIRRCMGFFLLDINPTSEA